VTEGLVYLLTTPFPRLCGRHLSFITFIGTLAGNLILTHFSLFSQNLYSYLPVPEDSE